MTTELDLKALRAAADAATPGPWRQGRLLNTRQTLKWDSKAREQADQAERMLVFANFSHFDEGRSRNRVSICTEAADAAFIAALNPTIAKRLLDRLEAAERDAARYRWARRPESGSQLFVIVSGGECGPNMDQSIDDARAAHQQEGV